MSFLFQGLVEIQYFGGWQNRIPVEKSTGRLILRSDHALVTIAKTEAPSMCVKSYIIIFLNRLLSRKGDLLCIILIPFSSKVYPEFGISKQDVRSYPTPTPCLKGRLTSVYTSVPPGMARLPMDFPSNNSQHVQVIGDPLESPRFVFYI